MHVWFKQYSRRFCELIIGISLACTQCWYALESARALELPAPASATLFKPTRPHAVALGRLLFYDPILSGGKAVSCATCHHPRFATSDGLSLGVGDGGVGLGPERTLDPRNRPEQRVPRNSPALFNLGAREFKRFFYDGRLEIDENLPGAIRTPLGQDMADGFASLLSAQAMFPVLSADEMAGHYAENEIATVVRQGRLTHEGGAWDLIARRVAAIAQYRQRFDAVIGADKPIRFTDIANVIADFIDFEWRAIDSPFDAYLKGQRDLPEAASRGLQLFYGKAGCASCHAGLLQTDHQFHSIAMPQLGPGKVARFENHSRDTGRFRVTGKRADLYRFRTPSLRNVAHTAPYGHSGAYATLDGVIRHHLDPVSGLKNYSRNQVVLPEFQGVSDWNILDDPDERAAIAAANELPPVDLSEHEITDVIAFLHSLTDARSLQGRLGVPVAVPSGLEVSQ